MTDLQTSLIVIGAVIVGGVISYNKWQEYKAKKSVERAFSSSHDDVLMGSGDKPAAERREPGFSPGEMPESMANVEAIQQEAIDQDMPADVAAVSASDGVPVELAFHAEERDLPVDYLIDCTIPLTPVMQLRGEKVLAAIQSLRHVGGKPVHYIGQRMDAKWEAVTHGGVYKALTAGVQLANRSSALNELEFSEFVM